MESVKLINWTSYALAILIYTKNTRLNAGITIQDIEAWPMEKKLEHLEYMRNTIQSSWEFVDYVFEVTGVDKNFTHQLVRTRVGASFAQQAQRVVDARNFEHSHLIDHPIYEMALAQSKNAYGELVDLGYPVQDARGVLPGSVHTEIIVKLNLRTMHNMGLLRLCKRAEGSYQRVFKKMVKEVNKIHPWTKDFIKVACAWNGICAFPLYKGCPVQEYTLKPNKSRLDLIQEVWDETEHVANPVAKEGRTM